MKDKLSDISRRVTGTLLLLPLMVLFFIGEPYSKITVFICAILMILEYSFLATKHFGMRCALIVLICCFGSTSLFLFDPIYHIVTLFLAAIFLKHLWKKFLLVFAAMLLAVFTNLLRSMFLTLWAYHNGSQAIDAHWYLPVIGDIGSVHDVTGLGILVLTCFGLLLLLPIFNFTLPKFEEDDDVQNELGASTGRCLL